MALGPLPNKREITGSRRLTCAGQILIQALATLRIATPNRAKSGEVADVLIQAFATLEGKS